MPMLGAGPYDVAVLEARELAARESLGECVWRSNQNHAATNDFSALAKPPRSITLLRWPDRITDPESGRSEAIISDSGVVFSSACGQKLFVVCAEECLWSAWFGCLESLPSWIQVEYEAESL